MYHFSAHICNHVHYRSSTLISSRHYITSLYICTLKVTEFITGVMKAVNETAIYRRILPTLSNFTQSHSYNCIVMCNKASWYLSLIYIEVISPTVTEQHEISVGVQQQVKAQPETGKLFIMHVSCTQANVFAVMHCRNTKFIVLHDLDVQWYPRFIDAAIHKEIFCHHFSSVLAACV